MLHCCAIIRPNCAKQKVGRGAYRAKGSQRFVRYFTQYQNAVE